MIKNPIHSAYAPRCSHPNCNNRVGYHDKQRKPDNTWSYHWKTFCEYHRTDVVGRAAVEAFKKSRGGCESWKLGWVCPGHHETLTIDHYDGNKHNNHEDNLLVLCPNCHQKKTSIYKDNLSRYVNFVELPESLWEISK